MLDNQFYKIYIYSLTVWYGTTQQFNLPSSDMFLCVGRPHSRGLSLVRTSQAEAETALVLLLDVCTAVLEGGHQTGFLAVWYGKDYVHLKGHRLT